MSDYSTSNGYKIASFTASISGLPPSHEDEPARRLEHLEWLSTDWGSFERWLLTEGLECIKDADGEYIGDTAKYWEGWHGSGKHRARIMEDARKELNALRGMNPE